MSSQFALVHTRTGKTAATVTRADNWWTLGWGVIGRRSLVPGTGLWLPGVSAVHTVFVRFSLDLLFLDEEFRTVRVCANVPPWRPLVRANKARHTVEVAAGTLSSFPIQPGDLWILKPVIQ